MAANKPLAMHSISGSFWTLLYILEFMPPAWREEYVKTIVFDSSPPKSDVYAFGGWFCYAMKLNPKLWKPLVSQLFHPYRLYSGINSKWEAENANRMKTCIPKSAHILFMHGRNDPVLDTQYISEYADFLRASGSASCVELLFDKSRHSMGIIDNPELYKATFINRLLCSVPGWQENFDAAPQPPSGTPDEKSVPLV